MAPSSHPQAQFVPISPDFDLDSLVQNTSNFDYVTRLSTEKLKEHSIQSFEALVLAVVIQSGKPLVIEDWGESLPPWLFSPTWIQNNLGSKPEQVRDIPNEVNIPMTIGHYLRSMDTLTKRITPQTFKDPKRQRLYLKDIDCPDAWAGHLKEVIPESVFYLNECIEPRTGGDGAIREPNEYGQMVYGKGVAPAGDLMSSLPPEMRALNMMCYVGHEGTYTPAHREMCASLGHNIMVEASEDRHGERAGSSIWFMTETKEREVVSEYFLSMLGHDIEVEKHFAQVNAWKKAPFNVWVVDQKVGDLILIPPLAPHQVWNRGTRTMKAAWNRTTVDTLELALHEALPRARMVCREEQYKNKAIIYYTLLKYHALLQRDTVEPKMWKYGRIKQVIEDFKRLFLLYTEILVSEMFSPKLPEEENVEFLEYDSNVTCSYCRGNIFNRFLTCKCCILVGPGGEEDTYDICMDCYAMGRSCACISNLQWVEQWKWDSLVDNYEQWRGTLVQADGFFDVARSPQPLEVARKRYGRKPVAEVCQEQLRIRPWNDITKEPVRELSPGMSDDEPEVDDEGRPKKKKGRNTARGGRRVIPTKNKTHTCHICCHHEYNWKLAFCTTCSLAYCYGVLWRAFDLMPQTVMEDKEWSCPRCLKMCSCGACRRGKNSKQKPYAPKGTLLGHDTRKVADYRSVESLVDFSKTNLTWLRGENESDPHESSRMKKLKEKAEIEKSRVDTIDESYFDGVAPTSFATDGDEGHSGTEHGIDPRILNGGESSAIHDELNGHYQSHFQVIDSANNVAGRTSMPGLEENPHLDWMDNDGHFDFDDLDPGCSFSQQPATYPSRLTAPNAPVEAIEPYPDPTHMGQNRMMGAGFYQQGSGADRILFDAPNDKGSTDESLQQTPSQNSNFAFSDLLDPVLKVEERKRKRYGHDDAAEEEGFYTSKRQTKIAQAKKARRGFGEDNGVSYNPRPAPRAPRRSTGQAQSYQDLGEDAVPIEDDEGPSAVTSHQLSRKSENRDSDMELAAQAMSRLSNPQTTQSPISGKKRGRPRKGEERQTRQTSTSQSASPVPSTIKTPRRSAWLERKEAVEAGVDLPDEISKRTRRPRMEQAPKTTIEILSSAEDSAGEEYTDSLFRKSVDRNSTERSRTKDPGSDGGLTWKASKENPRVQVVAPNAQSEIEADTSEIKQSPKQTPKPRGRPRKHPLPADLRSPTPIEELSGTPVKKLLSLKEKLALRGKKFKIVGAKRTVQPPSLTSSSVSTMPAREKTVTLPPVQPPVRKGPTVVRLMSPGFEESDGYHSSKSNSDTSEVTSDDESVASIPAVRVSPNAARRGAPARGRGGSLTGRGRGRPPSLRA